jgi:hypothetical protein
MENTDQELFEDFSDVVTSIVIKKTWTLTYKGQEITGTYSYESGVWDYSDKTVEIEEKHLENLSGEEIDEIHEFVEDAIG